jgi:hypothetical protein
LWLYAAVEPTTGEAFVLFLPRTDSPCLQAFLDAFQRHCAPGTDETIAVVLPFDKLRRQRQPYRRTGALAGRPAALAPAAAQPGTQSGGALV